ncbi:MAG TPA: hypothetical protein VGG03_00710 [Thermoanaerobaculia bacterium]
MPPEQLHADASALGLTPEVAALIADTPLMRDLPGPEDTAEVIRRYLRKGNYEKLSPERYTALMEDTVRRWPESRLAHEGLAQALLGGHGDPSPEALQRAAKEYLAAAEIGFSHGEVHYEMVIADVLGRTGDKAALDDYFAKVFSLIGDEKERYGAYLSYAQALSRLGDRRAEEYFLKAIDVSPGGLDPYELYAVYLLETGQPRKVLDLLSPQVLESAVSTRDFFRGLRCRALKQLGHDPKQEADCQVTSRPVPPSVGGAGSVPFVFEAAEGQKGDGSLESIFGKAHINNADDCRYNTSPGCAYHPADPNFYKICYNFLTWNLAEIIENEAFTEAPGSRVAVAWTVRDRVLRSKNPGGSLPACGGFPGGGGTCTSACPAPNLPETCDIQKRYCCVIHSGSFVDTHRSVTFQNIDFAYRVIEGGLPDPVSGYLPQGAGCSLNSCDGTVYCNTWGGELDFAPEGPIFFYGNRATSYRCLGYQPLVSTACSIVAGETCGDSADGSGSDNCYGRATRQRPWDGTQLACGAGCTSNGSIKRLISGANLFKTPTETPKFKDPGGKAFLLEAALESGTGASVRVQLLNSAGALLHDFGTLTVGSTTYTSYEFKSSIVILGPGSTVKVINNGPSVILVRKVTAHD